MDNQEHEFRFELKPVGVGYRCPTCKKGEMVVDPTGMVLTSMPAQIPHKCTDCEQVLHLPKQYPYVDWIKGEELTK